MYDPCLLSLRSLYSTWRTRLTFISPRLIQNMVSYLMGGIISGWNAEYGCILQKFQICRTVLILNILSSFCYLRMYLGPAVSFNLPLALGSNTYRTKQQQNPLLDGVSRFWVKNYSHQSKSKLENREVFACHWFKIVGPLGFISAKKTNKHQILEKLTLSISLSDKELIAFSYAENSIITRAHYNNSRCCRTKGQ